MSIVFFIIAVVVSLPVAAIVLVSLASRREDRSFSLGRPARGRVEQAARSILDFSTETRIDWAGASQDQAVAPAAPAAPAAPVKAIPRRRRIDEPLMATRMINFRHAA